MRRRRRGVDFDTAWARRPAAMTAREIILMGILGPIADHYTKPVAIGREVFNGLKFPVVFVANHSSHLDTISALRGLPRNWRRRTATVAAADYFYQNRVIASLVTLSFATVPIDRSGGLARATHQRLGQLLSDGWNILLYPEGTRSRDGRLGRLKDGASFIAIDQRVPIVPIGLKGTHHAMPPGAMWLRKHPVSVSFGQPIYPYPGEDHRALTARLEGAMRALRGEDPVA